MLLAAYAKAESAKKRQPENLSTRCMPNRHGLWPHHLRTPPFYRVRSDRLLELLEDALAARGQWPTIAAERGEASVLAPATLRRRC
jgi:hypothetical protein